MAEIISTKASENSIRALQHKLKEFAKARDWEKYHSPRNVAAALVVEAAELLELYQWADEAASTQLHSDAALREKIEDEAADILNYLLRFADLTNIDLLAAANRKIEKNERKYPADKVYGSSRKYTDYD